MTFCTHRLLAFALLTLSILLPSALFAQASKTQRTEVTVYVVYRAHKSGEQPSPGPAYDDQAEAERVAEGLRRETGLRDEQLYFNVKVVPEKRIKYLEVPGEARPDASLPPASQRPGGTGPTPGAGESASPSAAAMPTGGAGQGAAPAGGGSANGFDPGVKILRDGATGQRPENPNIQYVVTLQNGKQYPFTSRTEAYRYFYKINANPNWRATIREIPAGAASPSTALPQTPPRQVARPAAPVQPATRFHVYAYDPEGQDPRNPSLELQQSFSTLGEAQAFLAESAEELGEDGYQYAVIEDDSGRRIRRVNLNR